MNRIIDSNGVMHDLNGNVQNMFDINATRPYVKRYFDYSTTNKSFLNMHVFLKKAGVKNHNEHLQIYNKDLIGVDPYDPSLPDNVKLAIDRECRMNPWYYFRECCKIMQQAYRFELNLASYTSIYFMLRNINILMEATRQVGKTISITSMLAWVINFSGNGTNAANIHYQENTATDNMGRIWYCLENLPEYLRYHTRIISKKDQDGLVTLRTKTKSAQKKKTITCEMFNNTIETIVVGKDRESASNTGRGKTLHIAFIDELAHIKYNNLALKSLLPAMSTATMQRKIEGRIHGVWSLCTPGDIKSDTGAYVNNERQNSYMRFTYKDFCMFDMTGEELEEYIKRRSVNSVVYISYGFDNLGYTNEWLYRKSKMQLNDITVLRSDYLLKWEVQTTESPFSKVALSLLSTKSKIRGNNSTVYNITSEDSITIYYRDSDVIPSGNMSSYFLNFKNGLVIGIDVATGLGGNNDSTTMVAVDPTTLEVVFTYKRNDISVDDFAILLKDMLSEGGILSRQYLRVGLAIERNGGQGATLISILKKYKHLVDNFIVYPVKDNDNIEHIGGIPADMEFNYNGKITKFKIGKDITSTSRKAFINLLMTLVSKYTNCIAVPDLVKELQQLVVKVTASGESRVEASIGNHDDLVFAALHAYYAILFNTKLLEIRNKIRVTPETFKINDNAVSINTTSKLNKRIVTSFTSVNGHLVTTYYDTVSGKYVDERTATEISLKENTNEIINSTVTEHVPIETTTPEEITSVVNMIQQRYGVGENNDLDMKIVSVSELNNAKGSVSYIDTDELDFDNPKAVDDRLFNTVLERNSQDYLYDFSDIYGNL